MYKSTVSLEILPNWDNECFIRVCWSNLHETVPIIPALCLMLLGTYYASIIGGSLYICMCSVVYHSKPCYVRNQCTGGLNTVHG